MPLTPPRSKGLLPTLSITITETPVITNCNIKGSHQVFERKNSFILTTSNIATSCTTTRINPSIIFCLKDLTCETRWKNMNTFNRPSRIEIRVASAAAEKPAV